MGDQKIIKLPQFSQSEFFQDDIFVDTFDTATPVLTSTEWIQGVQKQPKSINLKPAGMSARKFRRTGTFTPFSLARTVSSAHPNTAVKSTRSKVGHCLL